MKDETVALATQFVDLLKKRPGFLWTKEDTAFVQRLLVEAGFDVKSVVRGKLVGNYLDDDGSKTGETFPINALCPFKAVGFESGEDYRATIWLDCLCWVPRGNYLGTPTRMEAIQKVSAEIERSVPLVPVQLTPEGDLLKEYPRDGGFVDHSRDSNKVSLCVGVHAFCHGWMDRNRATASNDSITCRCCGLRVLFPKKIKTYGELRDHFKSRFEAAKSEPIAA